MTSNLHHIYSLQNTLMNSASLRPTRIVVFIDEETEIPDPTGSKMEEQGF